MSRVVILTLDGDLESGIRVTLRQGERLDNAIAIKGQIVGHLRENLELAQLYNNWQQHYLKLEEICRTCRLEIDTDDESDRLLPPEDYQLVRQNCDRLAASLKDEMNGWLNSSANGFGFERIRHQLVAQLQTPNIRLLIQTSNPQLQRLPWHLWNLFNWQDDRRIEVAFSPIEYQEIPSISWQESIRILAILGNSKGINIQTDKAHLQKLAASSSCFLEQPKLRELEEKLRDKEGWDILVFAGHSQSDRTGERGRIYINDKESLSLGELRNAFGSAIQSRLKLAIFNSCDGLGLANELSKLNIPQAIVMREPVPDEVAHLFLEFFLEEFGKNEPVYQAVRIARERLESIENKLPYATWLPTIYQHPTVENRRVSSDLWSIIQQKKYSFLLAFLGLVGLAIGMFSLLSSRVNSKTCCATQGDKISCGEEIILPSNPWPKQIGVDAVVNSNYEKAFSLFMKSWSEFRDPETLIYLNNAFLEFVKADYYTIAVAIPVRKNSDGSVKDVHLAEELLRGVAQAQTEVNLGLKPADNPIMNFPGQKFLAGKSIKGKGLKVVIVDDENIEKNAIDRAKFIADQPNILGIVGHYASDISVETSKVYNSNQLVAISPGSTSKELSTPDYFFRTVPDTQSEAQDLADRLIQVGQKKAVIFYNPASPFTHSFREDFRQAFTSNGGSVIKEFTNLANPIFDAEKAIQEIEKLGETAIVLAPDGGVTNAQENAVNMIAANQNRHWIAATWGLYTEKTLQTAAKLPSFEKLFIPVTWHPFTSPNAQFSKLSEQLWGGGVNARTALAYDAARTLIKAIELQDKPTRQGMHAVMADPAFKAEGATGTIQFNKDGDRVNLPRQLVHIVSCPKSAFRVTFVPIQFATAEAAGLVCQ
jgi:branched-chain amino acid transport system substrate-binding protein